MAADYTEAQKQRWLKALPARLKIREERFRASGNVMHCWEAIADCNIAGFPSHSLPDWCVHYLAQVAAGLIQISAGHSRGDSEKINKRIVNVLRLNGSNRNEIQRHSDDKDAISHAALAEALAHAGEEEKVISLVMKKRSVSRRAAIEHLKSGHKQLLSSRKTVV